MGGREGAFSVAVACNGDGATYLFVIDAWVHSFKWLGKHEVFFGLALTLIHGRARDR